jgi:hypothetical protein
MPVDRHVVLGGTKFAIDEEADLSFRRISESVMVPRPEVAGVPGAENLNRSEWLWSMSDFSGGEGRLVFDREDAKNPPHFRTTDGAVDVRTKGEVTMSPVAANVVGDAGSVTRFEGNTLTVTAGSQTVVGSNLTGFDTTNDAARTGNRTPGAGVVTVNCRLVDAEMSMNASVTARLRVRNTTDSVDTASTSFTFGGGPPGTFTLTVSFTGVAGKTYQYFIEVTAASGNLPHEFSTDYIDEAVGASQPSDPRILAHGYGDEVWMVHFDGTNSDVFIWDFVNNDWSAVHSNVIAQVPVAMVASDRYQYILFANGLIYRFTTTAASGTQYIAAPVSGTAIGLAIANNRIYLLTTDRLYEIAIDQTVGLPLAENTANYKRIANPGDFYAKESGDQTLMHQMTGIGSGVRFFTTVRGGPTTIWEYSDGALKPIATLEHGYKATAIFHYSGVTWIGVQFTTRDTAGANRKRAGAYYIAADLVPRFLGYFRFHDPDDNHIQVITAYGHDIFFLQGPHVWRYDAGGGGITMDLHVGAQTPSNARGLAVMDRKMWIAYASQGVFVSENAYPIDQTIWLDAPVWDYDVSDMDKTLLRFDVVTKPLPANVSIEMQYQLDEDGTWVSAGTASTLNAKTHTFPVSTAASTKKARTVQWRVGMRSSDGISTPTIRSVTNRAYVLEYSDAFEMTLLLDDDNSTDHIRGQQLTGRGKSKLLWTLKANKQLVTFEDHYSASRPQEFDSYTGIIEDPYGDLEQDGQGSARIRVKVV